MPLLFAAIGIAVLMRHSPTWGCIVGGLFVLGFVIAIIGEAKDRRGRR
jgi:hypothetical protein